MEWGEAVESTARGLCLAWQAEEAELGLRPPSALHLRCCRIEVGCRRLPAGRRRAASGPCPTPILTPPRAPPPPPLPLPPPHPCRHKKVKLRVLKFYKVDDSGKVQRLRKVCPQCGPGIFMATHFNRVYCGKCHLTYGEHPHRCAGWVGKQAGWRASRAWPDVLGPGLCRA